MSADDIKRQKIAEQIMAHAREHYTEGGWDVIVECWDEAEVIRVVWGYDAPGEDTPITTGRRSHQRRRIKPAF